MSPLPILLGVGLLFLISQGNASASSGPSDAYKAGYKDGYAAGAAKKPALSEEEAKKRSEATASGNVNDYAWGYIRGQLDGAAASVKSGGGGSSGGGSTRAPKTYQIVVPSEWSVVSPSGDAFLYVGPGMSPPNYRAMVTAKPAGAQYAITGVLENSAGVDIRPGDKGDLYTKGSDGKWVYTLPPV